MPWILLLIDHERVSHKPPKTSQTTLLHLAEEEEEAEYPRHEEDLSLEVGDPISRTSPAMSVDNRDISLAIALSTAGINPAVARRVLHNHTTITSKKNPYKWHER